MSDIKQIKGVFKSHKVGYGFVKSIDPSFTEDVFIPKDYTLGAIEGDVVLIEISSKRSKKGWEGKVLDVVERKHTDLGGVVTQVEGKHAYVSCPLLGVDKEVKIVIPKDQELKRYDRISIQLKNDKSSNKVVLGSFEKYLGSLYDATCDTPCALVEYTLRHKFPKAVLDEVKALPQEIIAKDYPDHKDIQNLECFTIDPDTAKDYDDAISIEEKNGNTVLGVHIADVSHFVKDGTALDDEAYLRCNSTYFPDTCIPMLPSALSDNLCSLKADLPRLAVSTFMTFDKDGNLKNTHIQKSIINSRKRFTYKNVLMILEGKKESPFKESLEKLKVLALKLKSKRKARGCVDLALSDSKLMLDSKGIPEGIEVIEYDITHQMIEEFMLKNNEVIAKTLSDKKIAIPFRVHEPPKEDSLLDFMHIAESMGFKFSSKVTQSEIQALFEEIQGTPFEHQIAVNYIKCMKLAYYQIDNLGHFGLQLEYYSHFTSPIRRYVDLVIHRTLFDQKAQESLKDICDRCSDQERLSAKAEGSVRTLKLLRYFQKLEKDKRNTYTGYITKVKHFGVFFEIPEMLYEGFIHISRLGRDYYIFNDAKQAIVGERSREKLTVSKEVKIKIKNIDMLAREIEWLKVN